MYELVFICNVTGHFSTTIYYIPYCVCMYTLLLFTQPLCIETKQAETYKHKHELERDMTRQ